MAKAKNIPATKTKPADVNIINHQLILRPVDRSKKDIADWRNAHRAAEFSPLGTRTQLYDLYDDVLLDTHLSGIVDKRLMAVTNVKLSFKKDGKDVEELTPIIKSRAFKKMLKEILSTKLWGITLLEASFKPTFNIWSVPRKHIRPDKGIISLEQNQDTGINYREGMYINTMIEAGEPKDLGLLVKAVPYILYKRGCMGDFAQFSELFGMPIKIGKYSGYDEATRIALDKALFDAGSALSIVIPDEAKIELLEAKTTQSGHELYKSLINLCDEQLSILILGQTETTKSSSSSGYAQSKTHAETEDDINADDREYVLSYLETEVRHVLTQAGYPMEGGSWMFESEAEHVSLKDRVAIDTTLRNAGLPISDDYFYEKYDIPKPTPGQVKKEASSKAPVVNKKEELSLDDDLLQKMRAFFG